MSISSIRRSVPSASRPNSNLVSAIRMPRSAAYAARIACTARATRRAPARPGRRRAAADHVVEVDVLVVRARRRLGRGREDRLGQALGLAQAGRQADAARRAPRAPGSPSSRSRSGSRARSPRPAAPRRRRTTTRAARIQRGFDAGRQHRRDRTPVRWFGIRSGRAREPEIGDLRQHLALAGDRVGQHHVEGATGGRWPRSAGAARAGRRRRAPCRDGLSSSPGRSESDQRGGHGRGSSQAGILSARPRASVRPPACAPSDARPSAHACSPRAPRRPPAVKHFWQDRRRAAGPLVYPPPDGHRDRRRARPCLGRGHVRDLRRAAPGRREGAFRCRCSSWPVP